MLENTLYMTTTDKSLLTILITTYNRAPILDKELEILYGHEKRGLTFDVIVSNDCSSDNTEEICMKWKEKYRNLRYIRLTERSGMDKNFMTVYEAFETEYCWLLGDHRCIDYEGLKTILSKLEEHEHTAYIISSGGRQTIETKEYTEINNLMDEQGWHITDNSSCIIPRSFIKKEFYHRHMSTTFLHMGIMVENLCFLDKFNVLYMGDVVVEGVKVETYKGVGWGCHPFDNFGRWWFMFVMSLPNQITPETKLKVIKDHNRHSQLFSILNTIRKRCQYGEIFRNSYKNNRRYIKYISDTPRWVYDVLIYCPNALFKAVEFARYLYLLLIKRDEKKKYTTPTCH